MNKFFFVFAAALLLVGTAWGQGCVTCTNTAAQLGQDSAKALNIGILYLVAMPFCFAGTIAFILYRRYKNGVPDDSAQ